MTDDRYLPDPDAVEVRIGCEQDAEAEVAQRVCPMCAGTGRTYINYDVSQPRICPTCHGTGVK